MVPVLALLWALAWVGIPRAQAATDVVVSWSARPDPAYNPSLVEHNDKFISALKRTTFKKGKGKTYWVNHLYMCVGEYPDMQGLRCQDYYPWAEPYRECEFDARVRGGKVDVLGLGDMKVWAWPGKGVFAIFGRKPQRSPPSEPVCQSHVVYDQWVTRLLPDAGHAGEWNLTKPLRLYLEGYTYPKSEPFIMEKNWMPWIYREGEGGAERLLVTHMVQPHRVLECGPSGACAVLHETRGAPHLFDRFASFSVHGGPPVVWVSAALSGSGQPYYLGIMHHIEKYGPKKVKVYRHFAYKFEPQPPFAITAVSDELALTFYRHPEHPTKHFIAYVAGLYVNRQGTVYISYGAGDKEPRVLSMPLAELEALFTGDIKFLEHDKLPS